MGRLLLLVVIMIIIIILDDDGGGGASVVVIVILILMLRGRRRRQERRRVGVPGLVSPVSGRRVQRSIVVCIAPFGQSDSGGVNNDNGERGQ